MSSNVNVTDLDPRLPRQILRFATSDLQWVFSLKGFAFVRKAVRPRWQRRMHAWTAWVWKALGTSIGHRAFHPAALHFRFELYAPTGLPDQNSDGFHLAVVGFHRPGTNSDRKSTR